MMVSRERKIEMKGRLGEFTRNLVLWAFGVLLFCLCGSSPALAQGCAMCKTTLGAQMSGAIEALHLGIVILLVPPIGIMSTILFVTFRQDK